jgi:protein-S-isoprenylcysteine O-methyltransferase Ste14
MEYFILAILWIAFCALHSGLISITFTNFLKQRIKDSYRFYRLFYNIFSIVTLIPVLIYTASIRLQPFFAWTGYLLPVKYLLLFIGILCFVAGARHYSFGQFSGIAQIKEGPNHNLINETGELSSRGILGIVRHPFYAGIFPLIWSSDLDITALIINIILSIYVLIGTLLEERKLIAEFGDAYREYQQKVSMLFPLKWIKKKIGFSPA